MPSLLIAVAQESMSTPVMAAGRLVLATVILAALIAMCGRRALQALGAAIRAQPVTMIGVAVAAVLPNLLLGTSERNVPTGTTAVILAPRSGSPSAARF